MSVLTEEEQRLLAGMQAEVAANPRPSGGRGRGNPRLNPRMADPIAIGFDLHEPVGDAGGSSLTGARSSAEELLAPFLDPRRADEWESLSRALQPRDEDWDQIFDSEYADTARIAYSVVWRKLPVPRAHREHTQAHVVAVRAQGLIEGGLLAGRFPGAYARLAPRLKPDPIWVAWKFTAAGAAHGLSYDGLVWLRGRWVWVPKPWRLFR